MMIEFPRPFPWFLVSIFITISFINLFQRTTAEPFDKGPLRPRIPKQESPLEASSQPICFSKSDVMGCMYGVGFMDWDHHCRGEPGSTFHTKTFINKLGELDYVKLGSTPIKSCLFGDIGFSEVAPCSPVDSYLTDQSFEGLKGNVVIVVPLIRTQALSAPCPVIERDFSFEYSPQGFAGRANFFSGEVGDYVYYREASFPVNFTSYGRSDPLREYTGWFNPLPFWDFVSSIQLNCRNCKGFKHRISQTIQYIKNHHDAPKLMGLRRTRRSVSRYSPDSPGLRHIDNKPSQAQCNQLGYELTKPSYAPRPCASISQQYGNSWMFCSFQDTSHCNYDEAGDWEDGGIHEHCYQAISEFVSEITRCGFLQILQRSQDSDAVIKSLTDRLTGTVEALEDQVEFARERLGKGEEDRKGLRGQLARVNLDLVSLSRVVNSILDSYNSTGTRIDVTLRKLELLSLSNQVQVTENSRYLNLTAEYLNYLNMTSDKLHFEIYHPNGTVFTKHIFQEENLLNHSRALVTKIEQSETRAATQNKRIVIQLEKEINRTKIREAELEDAFQVKLAETRNFSAAIEIQLKHRAEITKNLTSEAIAELVKNEQAVIGFRTPRQIFGAVSAGFGVFTLLFILIICACICHASKA